MIPKLKLQTWKSSLNSTKVVILNNGTVNTIPKIQMTPIRNRALRIVIFSWVDKTPGKNDPKQSQANLQWRLRLTFEQ